MPCLSVWTIGTSLSGVMQRKLRLCCRLEHTMTRWVQADETRGRRRATRLIEAPAPSIEVPHHHPYNQAFSLSMNGIGLRERQSRHGHEDHIENRPNGVPGCRLMAPLRS